MLGAALALLAWRGDAGAEDRAVDPSERGVSHAAMMASRYQLQLATLASGMSRPRGGDDRPRAKRTPTVRRGVGPGAPRTEIARRPPRETRAGATAPGA